jgi:dTDP-4-dehydrorhamnose reductase
MKLLITGANGQLGQALVAACQVQAIQYVATTRYSMDISKLEVIKQQLALHQPNIVVNTAAYTAVDKAEAEPEQAYLMNAIGPKLLAEACAALQIPLIHISTDYVFAGDAKTPYQPSDICEPQSVYGASKLAGEQAIADLLPAHVIIRTAWLYSEYGHNFAKTMLNLAKVRNQISVVADQIGCPTYAPDLAHVILAVAKKLLQPSWHRFGVYHFVGSERMSWFEFAKMIMAVRQDCFQPVGSTGLSTVLSTVLSPEAIQPDLIPTAEDTIEKTQNLNTKVTPITTAEYPTAAKRPAYSVLNCQSLLQDFDIKPETTAVLCAVRHMIKVS